MSKSQTRLFTALFRNSFPALVLTAGLFSAVRAEESSYHPRPGGVHHPSDVEAGKRLADRLYREMLKNPAFAADIQGLTQYFR